MANIHSSISFALVNIPVVMNSAIKNNDTHFNQLHKKCQERVQYIKYCPHCKVKLKEKDIIKGYEYEKDNYVIFEKTELDKLKPENEKEIEIISFVPLKEIDSIYFEKSYILSSPSNSKSYNLFCEALNKSNLVAVAKTVISTKFYYCILRFMDNAIIMTTLYFQEEVNKIDNVKGKTSGAKELDLAMKIISSLKGHFEPEKYKDEYQNNIKKSIDLKLDGKEIKGKRKKNQKKITDLMEALEKSLASE